MRVLFYMQSYILSEKKQKGGVYSGYIESMERPQGDAIDLGREIYDRRTENDDCCIGTTRGKCAGETGREASRRSFQRKT